MPPSKIYETLQKLKNRGAVIDSQTQPTLYLPVEAAAFFRRIQEESEKTMKSLVADLSDLAPVRNFQVTWNLNGSDQINEKLVEIITAATDSVYASVWPEQIEAINPALSAAMERNVYVVLAGFGDRCPAAHLFYNLEACAANVENRTQARLCTVVADNKEVVIGELSRDGEASTGIWTQTRSVVLVAKEYIRHDLMVGVLSEQLGEAACRCLMQQHPLLWGR